MDKMLIFGLSEYFHTEVNIEMIPNLSGQAVESLKIERVLKIFIVKIKTFFLKIEKYF
jgi:hypothetical protein